MPLSPPPAPPSFVPPAWLTFIAGPLLAIAASYVGVQVSLTEQKTNQANTAARVSSIEARMDRDDTARRATESLLGEVRARQAAGAEQVARLNRDMELLDSRSADRHAAAVAQVATLRTDTALQVGALRDFLTRLIPSGRRLDGSATDSALPPDAELRTSIRSPAP